MAVFWMPDSLWTRHFIPTFGTMTSTKSHRLPLKVRLDREKKITGIRLMWLNSSHPPASVHMCHSTVTVNRLSSSADPTDKQISGDKMLMSVVMATVTPGEPAVTFSAFRLMIRRPDLSAVLLVAQISGGEVSQRSFTVKTHCDKSNKHKWPNSSWRGHAERSVTSDWKSTRNVYTSCDPCHKINTEYNSLKYAAEKKQINPPISNSYKKIKYSTL